MRSFKSLTSILFCCFVLCCFTMTSCKTGEGCANQQQYAADVDKNGNLSTKRGKSTLFSKNQKKKKR